MINQIKLYENGVINSKQEEADWSKIYLRSHACTCLHFLKKMEEIGVKPNLQTYNVLMSLWGNSQQQGEAESIPTILEDEDGYQNGRKDASMLGQRALITGRLKVQKPY